MVEQDMNPKQIEHELARERRAKLLDLTNPAIKQLDTTIRSVVTAISKPGINVDVMTEMLLTQSLYFAHMDQLSGLSNRAGVMVELEAAAAVAKTLKLPLSVLFIDGKSFKEINDTISHDVGDQVITAVGEALNKGARRAFDIKLHLTPEQAIHDEDKPNAETGRVGGDEFIIILLGTTEEGARKVAQNVELNITKTVDERVPIYRQTFNKGFEVTIGQANFIPDSDETGKDILLRADQDLTNQRAALGETRRS